MQVLTKAFSGRRGLMLCGVLVVPALVVGTLVLSGGGKAPAHEEHAVRSTDPPTVLVTAPRVRNIIRIVGQPSFVEAYERTSVYPKMTAYIEKWNVDIGDKVKKGDVLASLYVPELVELHETKIAEVELAKQRIELARKVVRVAEADVKAADARLKETRAILDQYEAQVIRWEVQVKRLRHEVEKTGVVDPQVLLESENQLRATKAQRDAAKASIEKADADVLSKNATKFQDDIAVAVAQANLKVAESEQKRLKALVGYLVLPAPFEGIVTARNANTFDFVLPASGDPTATQNSPHLSPSGKAAPIYVVARTDIVRVFVDIPEKDANFVQNGAKASVLIRGYRDEPIQGTVTRTSWALNVTSRTLRAEIDLPNVNAQILPGMYAYGKVFIKRPNVWAMREKDLFRVGDQTFFWMRGKNSEGKDIAIKAEVETGASDGTWIEVTNWRIPPKDVVAQDEDGTPQTGSAEEAVARRDNPWTPINDAVEVLTTEDLTAITDGDAVIVQSPSKQQHGK